MRLFRQSQTPPVSLEAEERAILAQLNGTPETWADRERELRATFAALDPVVRDKEISLHHGMFVRDQASLYDPDGITQRRRRSLAAVLAPQTPAQRERFLYFLERNCT